MSKSICHYCEDPDKYGVLPAEEVTYFDWCMHSSTREQTIKSVVHRDKHQAGTHVGITCKNVNPS